MLIVSVMNCRCAQDDVEVKLMMGDELCLIELNM
jgi:hypothetical protein